MLDPAVGRKGSPIKHTDSICSRPIVAFSSREMMACRLLEDLALIKFPKPTFSVARQNWFCSL